jgi:hypothetical protein
MTRKVSLSEIPRAKKNPDLNPREMLVCITEKKAAPGANDKISPIGSAFSSIDNNMYTILNCKSTIFNSIKLLILIEKMDKKKILAKKKGKNMRKILYYCNRKL